MYGWRATGSCGLEDAQVLGQPSIVSSRTSGLLYVCANVRKRVVVAPDVIKASACANAPYEHL